MRKSLPKVLLVDDDRAITSLLKTLLKMEPEDFEVSAFPSGKDALQAALADPPDVFMVDYHLKDMDGLELIQQLRQHDSLVNIPIVMASGLDVQVDALAVGANMFLLKPFEPSELPAIFLDLIGQK